MFSFYSTSIPCFQKFWASWILFGEMSLWGYDLGYADSVAQLKRFLESVQCILVVSAARMIKKSPTTKDQFPMSVWAQSLKWFRDQKIVVIELVLTIIIKVVGSRNFQEYTLENFTCNLKKHLVEKEYHLPNLHFLGSTLMFRGVPMRLFASWHGRSYHVNWLCHIGLSGFTHKNLLGANQDVCKSPIAPIPMKPNMESYITYVCHYIQPQQCTRSNQAISQLKKKKGRYGSFNTQLLIFRWEFRSRCGPDIMAGQFSTFS